MEHENHSDEGILAAKRLAWEYDPEPSHAFQVRRIAMDLYMQLQGLHGLGEDAARLLNAAAIAHDIGYCVSPSGHHKRSHDMILEAKLPGFDDADRQVIASVARYHRKAHPEADHKGYADLDSSRQRMVRVLSAILRVADGLDRAHDAATEGVEVSVEPDEILILVYQRQESELDVEGARRKSGLFEDVFGKRVRIEPAGA